MGKIKMNDFVVILDMDGVIVDNNKFHKEAWNIFCKKYKLNISEENFKRYVYGKTNSEILKFTFNKRLTKKEANKYADEKESIYRKIYGKQMCPIKGLLKFLKDLKKNKINIAIASSAPPKNIDFILKGLQIKKYFNVIVNGTEIRKSKPNPEIYLKASDKMKVKPSKCIVFEDSLSGIKAAKNAGMKVIALTTTHNKDGLSTADYVIKDFNKMPLSKLKCLN